MHKTDAADAAWLGRLLFLARGLRHLRELHDGLLMRMRGTNGLQSVVSLQIIAAKNVLLANLHVIQYVYFVRALSFASSS